MLSLCYSHTTGPHSSQSPATWEFPLPSSGAECRGWGAGFPRSGEAGPLHGRQGGSQSVSTLWGTPDPEPAPGKSVSYFLHEATKIWGFYSNELIMAKRKEEAGFFKSKARIVHIFEPSKWPEIKRTMNEPRARSRSSWLSRNESDWHP